MHRDESRFPEPGPEGPGALDRLLNQVRLRAYEIHRDRVASHVPGDETSDWKAAEQDVLGAEGLLPVRREAAPPEPVEPETSLPSDHPAIGEMAALERAAAALGSLTARDIMHGRVGAVGPECTLGQLARALDESGVPAVAVVDGRQRLMGVVSVTDLVHGAALAQASAARLPGDEAAGRPAGQMLASVRVGDVCSRALVAALPEATLIELSGLMAGHRVNQVLIVDEERIVGMVTALDVVSSIWSRFSPPRRHYTVP